MKITVEMTAEEFQEFMAWRAEKDMYDKENEKEYNKREYLCKKILWAVDKDPKKPEKCKIINQEHAVELVEMANEFFA